MYIYFIIKPKNDNILDEIPSSIEFLTATDMAGSWKVPLQIHWIFAFLFRLPT